MWIRYWWETKVAKQVGSTSKQDQKIYCILIAVVYLWPLVGQANEATVEERVSHTVGNLFFSLLLVLAKEKFNRLDITLFTSSYLAILRYHAPFSRSSSFCE